MKKITLIVVFLLMVSLPASAQGSVTPIGYSDVHNLAGIDIKPEFPGGLPEFYKFISQNYVVPEHPEMQSGKIIASFVIEKDGAVSEVKILRDIGYGSGDEAIRVLQMSPKWTPGVQNGQPVRVMFSIPISITVPEPDPVYNELDVDLKPHYPGGDEELMLFFKKNFNGKGSFDIEFVVESNGLVTFIKCGTANSADCTEIKRVLISGPRWKPGKKGKHAVRTQVKRTIKIK